MGFVPSEFVGPGPTNRLKIRQFIFRVKERNDGFSGNSENEVEIAIFARRNVRAWNESDRVVAVWEGTGGNSKVIRMMLRIT